MAPGLYRVRAHRGNYYHMPELIFLIVRVVQTDPQNSFFIVSGIIEGTNHIQTLGLYDDEVVPL